MKKQKLKFIVPALAMLLAVVASSFSTLEKSNTGEDLAIQGRYYLNAANPCASITMPDCQLDATFICTYGSETVFRENSNCLVPLKRNY